MAELALDRYVVRPRPRNLVVALLGCVVFVAVGAWLVETGGAIAVVAGLTGMVVFGAGALVVGTVAARRDLSKLTLTPAGLEVAGGGTAAWPDIEEVAVVAAPATMLAVRLRAYEHYAAGDLRRVDQLVRTRQRIGFDLAFSPVWLDRPVDEFVHLLESYRATYS
jgi:hypothetical protein